MANLDDIPAEFGSVSLAGQGTGGTVYRATLADGQVVAVKVLAPALVGRPDAVWEFQAEVRLLGHLDHPAFPRPRGEGLTAAGAPYFAMDWAPGEPPPPGPWPAARVRGTLLAIARALAHLHAAGFVHGDLKPDNVRVDGEAVGLLDLGLARRIGERPQSVAGTPAFMAPEVYRRADADPRADLYALGVMAYGWLAGRMPFTGDARALLAAHLGEPVPPFAAEVAGADAPLADLVMSLLAKDPAARPAGALGLVELLETGRTAPHEARRLLPAPFVGREAAMAPWPACVAADRPRWLVAVGEAGSGKSTWLDECRVVAEQAGRFWLGVACREADAPDAASRGIVGQVLAAAGLVPGAVVAAWLAGAVPPALAELEPATRVLACHHAAAGELERAAERLGGVALGLDDWHLADGASQAFVTQLFARQSAAPIAWALARGPGGAVTDGARVSLGPLDAAQVAQVVTTRLGGSAPDGLAARLYQLSGGLPRDLARWLERQVEAGDDAALPEDLAALLATKVAGLPPAARTLAGAAALAGAARPLPIPLLGLAADLSGTELAAAVDALARAGVMAVEHGRLAPLDAGLAEALAAGLPVGIRRTMATKLARALAAHATTAPDGAEVLPLAARLAFAGDDADLARRLGGQAGEQALARGNPAEALAMFEGALGQAGGDAPLDLSIPRADALRFLDRLAEAASGYTEALAAAGPEAPQAQLGEAWAGLAKCRQMQGDAPGALAALDAAEAAAIAAARPTLLARVLMARARLGILSGDGVRALADCQRAAEAARAAGAHALEARAITVRAVYAVQSDPANAGTAMAVLAGARATLAEVGDRLGEALALDGLGNILLELGRLGEAGEAFDAYSALCRELGLATEAISADLNRAIVTAEIGDPTSARLLATEVADRAFAAGRKFARAAAVAVSGFASWRGGKLDQADAQLDLALELAAAVGGAGLEIHVRTYRLDVALDAGRNAEAATELARLTVLAAGAGIPLPDRFTCAEAELARRAGDEGNARVIWWQRCGAVCRLAAYRAHCGLADLALAAGDAKAAVTHATAALGLVAGPAPGGAIVANPTGGTWVREAALARLARAYTADGDDEGARRIAAEVYAGAGIGNFLARAQLAQAGGGVPAAVASTWKTGLARVLASVAPMAQAPFLLAHGLAPDLAPEADDAPEHGTRPSALGARLAGVALAADMDELADATLTAALATFGGQRGALLLYEAGTLTRVVARQMSPDAALGQAYSRSMVEEVLLTTEPLVVLDAASDPAWQAMASVAALGLRTVVCLPVATRRRILGVLAMDRDEPVEPPDAEELAGLQLVVDFAAERLAMMMSAAAPRHRRASTVRRYRAE